MKHKVKLDVNEEIWEIDIAPHRTLLDVLNEDLGLMGTKEGCGMGACGACTVLIDGVPTLSCLTLALDVQERSILTIEGLGTEDEPAPIQKAFVEHGALQCGFCTPGMIMSSKALLDNNPNPSQEEIKDAISGNLCRCTGYKKIIEAVESLAEK